MFSTNNPGDCNGTVGKLWSPQITACHHGNSRKEEMITFTFISALAALMQREQCPRGLVQLKSIVICSWEWLLSFPPPCFGRGLCETGVLSVLTRLLSDLQLMRVRNYRLEHKQS